MFTVSNFLMLTTIIFFAPLWASAQLQVFPLRTTLSETERVAQLSLRHKGEKAKVYRISQVFYRMNVDGSLERATQTTPEDKNSSDYFRFSPRQVTLEPDKEQVVRLILRKPADLAEGEYRAHLYFEEVDESVPAALAPEKITQTLIKAKLAIAVPVIVRIGNPTVQVELTDLKIETTNLAEPKAQFVMQSTGTGIAYGNFRIFMTTPDGLKKQIGKVVGVSSYIPKRMVSFPIETPTIPPGSKVDLEFYENSDNESEAKLLARTGLMLPNVGAQ